MMALLTLESKRKMSSKLKVSVGNAKQLGQLSVHWEVGSLRETPSSGTSKPSVLPRVGCQSGCIDRRRRCRNVVVDIRLVATVVTMFFLFVTQIDTCTGSGLAREQLASGQVVWNFWRRGTTSVLMMLRRRKWRWILRKGWVRRG